MTTQIRTNYRSASAIVDLGNRLMRGRGPAAVAAQSTRGVVWRCDLAGFQQTSIEKERHAGDELTPAVLRLVRYYLGGGQDVVLLSRRNGLPWYVHAGDQFRGILDELDRFLEQVRSYLPGA
jgi:DNA helicase-4